MTKFEGGMLEGLLLGDGPAGALEVPLGVELTAGGGGRELVGPFDVALELAVCGDGICEVVEENPFVVVVVLVVVVPLFRTVVPGMNARRRHGGASFYFANQRNKPLAG